MALFKKEFPDYDGEFHVPEGFIDCSWHNDIMPKVTRLLLKDGMEYRYDVWQDYEDPDKREYGDMHARFNFTIKVDDEEIYSFGSDNWDDIDMALKGVPIPMYGYNEI